MKQGVYLRKYFFSLFCIMLISVDLSYCIKSRIEEQRGKNTIQVTVREVKDNKDKSNALPENKKSGVKVVKNNVKIFDNNKSPVTNSNPKPIQKATPPISTANLIPNKHETTTKVGNSVIKQESVEYTLPALPVDSKHKIENYYPYFYKTHVIDYYDAIDMHDLTNDCLESGCEWCTKVNRMECKQCRHGYYLYNNQCYTVCPDHYIADIFKRACHPVDITNTLTQISYLKAFTVGSCKNICGKVSTDCSCLPSCISEGNCCSDYHSCEYLINKNSLRQAECTAKNPNCDLCEDFPETASVVAKCGQCKEGLWNRQGDCLQSCVSDDSAMPTNRICISNNNCLIQNCAECVQNNPSVCRTCSNGFYMYNNQCLQTCPLRLRADRIAWACLEPPVFAWYWIFPSKSTCRNKCGRTIDSEMDCSCHADCFRAGDCCQDVEDYCPQYIYWK